MSAIVLVAAIGLDALVGDPDVLWRRVPHPVVLFGRAIGLADGRFNREGDADARRKALGAATMVLLIGGAAVIGLEIDLLTGSLGPFGWALEVVVVAVLLAGRSLADHVVAVREGLGHGLEAGRYAVSMIVGRDPELLDEAGVARAAIESLAENFADGVVAPALWYLAAGLPGLLVYKLVNTADSMIGHRSTRHLHFGWAAARLDDGMNWPAARLTAVMILATSPRSIAGWRGIANDAARHRSPNAGWPEAAMATVLGIALGGPRSYGQGVLNEPWLNAGGRRVVATSDIDDAIRVYRDALLIFSSCIAFLALA